jgi:hypothetical protein
MLLRPKVRQLATKRPNLHRALLAPAPAQKLSWDHLVTDRACGRLLTTAETQTGQNGFMELFLN